VDELLETPRRTNLEEAVPRVLLLPQLQQTKRTTERMSTVRKGSRHMNS
jgi:hypothetical protein